MSGKTTRQNESSCRQVENARVNSARSSEGHQVVGIQSLLGKTVVGYGSTFRDLSTVRDDGTSLAFALVGPNVVTGSGLSKKRLGRLRSCRQVENARVSRRPHA